MGNMTIFIIKFIFCAIIYLFVIEDVTMYTVGSLPMGLLHKNLLGTFLTYYVLKLKLN